MPNSLIDHSEEKIWEKDLRKIWRVLRPIVKDRCTFAEIKDVVSISGLPVEELTHLQQRSLTERGASKSGIA